jgi:hypothetical protein
MVHYAASCLNTDGVVRWSMSAGAKSNAFERAFVFAQMNIEESLYQVRCAIFLTFTNHADVLI